MHAIVKKIEPLPKYRLMALFDNGERRIYDVTPWIDNKRAFAPLRDTRGLFERVRTDCGGMGIAWNDEIDLDADELWEHGTQVHTPFDGLIAFSDATELWGLNESTLRKAISYGKLVDGVDVCKFGKQWVVSMDAMQREYGSRQERE